MDGSAGIAGVSRRAAPQRTRWQSAGAFDGRRGIPVLRSTGRLARSWTAPHACV